MKLLVQSDDYGFTKAVTFATIDAIKNGIINCTGLFANMPSAKLAMDLIKGCPDVCLGIDINVVSGKPCANPKQIPHLIDKKTGEFILSSVRKKDPRWGKADLYPYDEVFIEAEAQIMQFMKLSGGKMPEYIHGHSIGESSANYRKVLHDLSIQYGIAFTRDIYEQYDVIRLKGSGEKPFSIQNQLTSDSEANCLHQLDRYKNAKYVRIGGHCGFVDEDLLNYSTYTIVRAKDYVMYTSEKIQQWIKENQVELITYRDLKIEK